MRYHTTSEGNIPFTAEEEAEWDARESTIATEIVELAKTQYQRNRAAEYPSINNYIDGVVKGDQAQIQAYIDACLAVKAKYPKPDAT
jgi:uncharacterized protein (UPF0297 family)